MILVIQAFDFSPVRNVGKCWVESMAPHRSLADTVSVEYPNHPEDVAISDTCLQATRLSQKFGSDPSPHGLILLAHLKQEPL